MFVSFSYVEPGKKDKLTTNSKDQSLTQLSQINLVDIVELSATQCLAIITFCLIFFLRQIQKRIKVLKNLVSCLIALPLDNVRSNLTYIND